MIFRDRAFISLDSIDSTNNYAANLLKLSPPPDGSVITALEQTAGKGQRGASWLSTKGENLLCSIIVYPTFLKSDENFLLSQISALAVKDTVEELIETDVWVKWPNDVLVHNMKVSGMLIECNWNQQRIQSAIIGIGMNVNQTLWDIDHTLSIRSIKKQFTPTQDVLSLLIQHFDRRYEQLKSGFHTAIRNEYNNCLFGRDVMNSYAYKGEVIQAIVLRAEQDGLLLIRSSEGKEIKVDLKEIQLIRN